MKHRHTDASTHKHTHVHIYYVSIHIAKLSEHTGAPGISFFHTIFTKILTIIANQ